MTDNKCVLVFRMVDGTFYRSEVFDGPGYATDWLESGLKFECPEGTGEKYIIVRQDREGYVLVNTRYVVSIKLRYVDDNMNYKGRQE